MEERILEALKGRGPVRLDELVGEMAYAGWGPVYLAVDRLSRAGVVVLNREGPTAYCVSLHPTPPSRGPAVRAGLW